MGGQEPAVRRRLLQCHEPDRKSTCTPAMSCCHVANGARKQLTLLRTLILWSMASSDTVKGLINQSYKQNRHEDDLNQPRSVQPWGSDGDKRRYFLVEGQDDTHFRVYRESNPAGTNRTWWSVAGSIEELKALTEKLETKDGGPKAKKLGQKMSHAIPRFEVGEEVSAPRPNTSYLRCPLSQYEGTRERIHANNDYRSANAESTARCERNSSSGPSLVSPCMRAAPVESG